MALTIEVEQEDDGRWLAEVPELPGVLTYGQTRHEAIDRVQALSLRVLADLWLPTSNPCFWPLLHRHAFGQIPRLIDVAAA